MHFPGWTYTGNFLFSQPSSNVHYQENADREFVSAVGDRVLSERAVILVSGGGELPHTTASLGAEIRPLKRVRMTESWLTDGCTMRESSSMQTMCPWAGAADGAAAPVVFW